MPRQATFAARRGEQMRDAREGSPEDRLSQPLMPVRGVVHGQTASSFGWKGLKP